MRPGAEWLKNGIFDALMKFAASAADLGSPKLNECRGAALLRERVPKRKPKGKRAAEANSKRCTSASSPAPASLADASL
jgi:hypothetical protein